MNIHIDRLRDSLIRLSDFGRDPDGGITRISYSPQYEAAVTYVAELMEAAGLKVRRDSVGNLFGTLEGQTNRTILVGSHIDSVPHGGMFDGSLGVMAGLEVARTIHEQGRLLNHSLTVAAFADEEGAAILGTLGSKSFCGQQFSKYIPMEKLQSHGLTLQDIADAKGDLDALDCYLELHIEQGGVLEQAGLPLGIVNGIVGIIRYRATVLGNANHAGCTPMHMRKDALRNAIGIINRLYQLAEQAPGGMVATVGQIAVKPGAPNVIPGEAEFTIELRSIDAQDCYRLMEQLSKEFHAMPVQFSQIMEEPPVRLSPVVVHALETAAKSAGFPYQIMVSGAGHDAIPLAQVTNAGMIFIPSIGGVSHCPEENSDWEHIALGTQLLLNTVQELDQSAALQSGHATAEVSSPL